MRLLLHHVPEATSFADIRTVNSEVCETFREAAKQLGLLESGEEYDIDLAVATVASSAKQVRQLFTMMLMFGELYQPYVLFIYHLEYLGEDLYMLNTIWMKSDNWF